MMLPSYQGYGDHYTYATADENLIVGLDPLRSPPVFRVVYCSQLRLTAGLVEESPRVFDLDGYYGGNGDTVSLPLTAQGFAIIVGYSPSTNNMCGPFVSGANTRMYSGGRRPALYKCKEQNEREGSGRLYMLSRGLGVVTSQAAAMAWSLEFWD